MRKIKYVLLICVMIFAITACGNKEEDVVIDETEVVENTEEKPSEESADTKPVTIFGVFDSQTLEGEKVTEDIFANADLTMVKF